MSTYKNCEKRSTKQQFEFDFGVYPPNSVTIDTPLDLHFTIRTFCFFSFLKLIMGHVLELLKNNSSNNNSSLSNELAETRKHLKALKLSLKEIKDLIRGDNKSSIRKPLLTLVFFVIFALATPIVTIYSVVVMTKCIVSIYLTQKRNVGFVVDFDHSSIYIRKDIRDDDKANGIISHEHIHICQQSRSIAPFQSHRLPCNFFRSVSDSFLTESLVAHLNYLHKTHELEARLHEIILSYYRHVERLPQNYNSFIFAILCVYGIRASLSEDELRTIISCLMGSPTLNDKNRLILDEIYNDLNAFDSREYEIRFELVVEDFYQLIRHISSSQDRVNFILDVLPIAYTNLLDYYGATELARNIRLEITRPNMFDLYYSPL